MLPAIVLPFHDPQAVMLPYLWQLDAWLKHSFTNAYIGLSHPTQLNQPEAVDRLQNDPFYRLTFNQPGIQPGEHYRAVYQSAVDQSPPEQRLHLCDFDRPVFALSTGYRRPTWTILPGRMPRPTGALPAHPSCLGYLSGQLPRDRGPGDPGR